MPDLEHADFVSSVEGNTVDSLLSPVISQLMVIGSIARPTQ